MKQAFAMFLLIFSVLIVPQVAFAQSTFQSGDSVALTSAQKINGDYFGAGKSVTIEGKVAGDAYVAGGEVTVNGTVDGDLLVAGGNITVNGVVGGSIRGAGGTIYVNGAVKRNLTLAGGNLLISPSATVSGSLIAVGGSISVNGTVTHDATFAGGRVSIHGTVGGNVNGAVGELSLENTAKVGGSVNYLSQNKAVVSPEASISGALVQHVPPERSQKSYTVGRQVAKETARGIFSFFKIIGFLSALLIGWLLIKLAPHFTERVQVTMKQKWLPSLGIGFLVLIATPVTIILLLVTLIGIPLIFVWLFFLGVAVWLSKIFMALTIGAGLLGYLKRPANSYMTLLVGLVLYYLLTWIPVIGWLFGCVTALIGIGTLLTLKLTYIKELRQKKVL